MREKLSSIFTGPNGSLRLTIDQYQFPEIVDGTWDSNWLIIAGDVVIDGGHWTFRDPSLLAFEVERLAGWLDLVVNGEEPSASCGFVEPNLQFDREANDFVRIGFALEAAPPWATTDDDWYEYGVNVPIDENLAIAVRRLRDQLSHFPVRGERPSVT
jgi:hypothetical protein